MIVFFYCFYFITVQKVKEYRLSSGIVSRNEGFIEKGTTTDVCNHDNKLLIIYD